MDADEALLAPAAPTTTGAPRAGRPAHRSPRATPWWATAIAALVVSRVVSTVAVTVAGRHHHLSLLATWTQWDSSFYLQAARTGWPHHVDPHVYNTTAFFPGLPLAIRAAHDLTGLGWQVSGLVTDGVFEITMALAIAALLHHRLPVDVAGRATWLVLLFPGAYILPLVYSEPLFITAAALCLLCLSLGHRRLSAWWWLGAGVAAAVAGATRPTGIILCACCAWAAVVELRRRRPTVLIAPVCSVAGLVAYAAFLAVRTGSPDSYVRTQDDAWKQRPTIDAIPEQISAVAHHHAIDALYLVMLVAGVIATVLLARLVRQGTLPGEWLIYGAGALLICLTSRYVGFRLRFAFTAFPLIVAVAWHLRGRWYRAAVAASVVGLAGAAYLTSHFVP